MQSRLPRRAFTPQSHGPVEDIVEFSIEVFSPDDRFSRVIERVDLYLPSGTQLIWLVDPEAQSIAVYPPGEQPVTHRIGETIDAQPILKDFCLDLAALFAVLEN